VKKLFRLSRSSEGGPERDAIEDFRIKPLANIVHSRFFELSIAVVIAMDAISLAMLTIPGISPEARASAIAFGTVAFVIYLLELVVRIISYGAKPWKFFHRGWNVFDFLVIGTAPFFESATTFFRLLRLFRLIRIFRFLPEVRILSVSVAKSIPPLVSMSALIGVLLFLYGMAGVYLFGDQLEKNWGSIGAAMMSLFILLTLENFPAYLQEGLGASPFAIPFFFSYVFVIVFTVLNILIGIVLNAMDEARQEEASVKKETDQLNVIVDKLEMALSDKVISHDELLELKDELIKVRQLRKR
jgi:voltage-gated sodium channel